MKTTRNYLARHPLLGKSHAHDDKRKGKLERRDAKRQLQAVMAKLYRR